MHVCEYQLVRGGNNCMVIYDNFLSQRYLSVE